MGARSVQKLVDEMEICMNFEIEINDKFHAYEMMKVIEIKLMKKINVCDCPNKCFDFQTLKYDTQNTRVIIALRTNVFNQGLPNRRKSARLD